MKKISLFIIINISLIGIINGQIITSNNSPFSDKNISERKFDKTIKGKDTLYTYKPEIIGQLPKSDSNLAKKNNALKSLKSTSSGFSDLSHIPSNYTVDKTKDIGVIQMIQNDNQDGSLSYTIPIDINNTGNSLDPNIQLAYNSNGGNGIAGMGWQIGGLSAISAVGSTFYYDNKVDPPYANAFAAFMLDGLRLIYIGGTEGVREYETETGNIKVTAYMEAEPYLTVKLWHIKYFTVSYPNGQIGTYGYKTNTRGKLNYPLTQMVDNKGNYIDYNYNFENNIYYISEVNYGGVIAGTNRTAINHTCKVVFSYETRSDVTRLWVGELEINQNKRLKKIDSFYNSQLIQSYTCNYKTANGVSLLSQLDCSNSSKSLNPLLFYYGINNQVVGFEKSSVLLSSYFANLKVPALVLSKGKFDYDSQSDGIISYPRKESYGIVASLKDYWGNIKAYQYGSTYHPDENLLIYDDVSHGLATPIQMKAENGFIQLIPLDINGDGIDELVKINSNVINSSTEALSFKVYDVINVLGQSVPQLKSSFTANMGGVVNWEGLLSPAIKTLLTGDFLGKGKQDVVALSYCKNVKGQFVISTVTLIEIDKKIKSPTHDETYLDFELEDYAFVIDFDGDGKSDIVHVGKNGTKIYSFGLNGGLFEIGSYSNITRYSLINKELTMGDINGDGKTDIILTPVRDRFYNNYKETPCRRCNGCTRGMYESYPVDPANLEDDHSHVDTFIDGVSLAKNENNDSINKSFLTFQPFAFTPIPKCNNPIITTTRVYYSDAKTWTVLYSTGSTFVSETHDIVSNDDNMKFALQDMNGDIIPDLVINKNGIISAYLTTNGKINTTPEPTSCSVNSAAHFIVGSVEQNYKMSQLFSIYDSELTPITFTRDDKIQSMLSGSVNSAGVISKHTYSSIQGTNSNVYKRGDKSSYPYLNLTGNMYLLSQSEAYVNNNTIYSISKTYEDGLVDLNKKAFLGFKKVTSYDNVNSNNSVSIFDVFNNGLLKSAETNTSLITNEYSISIASNKISKIRLTKSIQKDKLKDLSVTNSYVYDTYGNATKSITDYGNGIKSTTDRLFNNYTSTAAYLLGELYQETVTNERGGTVHVTKNVFTFSNFLPQTKKSYINGNLFFEETYKYNSYGFITESSAKNYNSPTWLTSKFTFDSLNRLTEKTSELGLKETYTYNTLGLLVTVKDFSNRETKFEYDSWGNKIKTTNPAGIIENVTTTWAASPSGVLYQTTYSLAGIAHSKTFSDALGRTIRKSDLRADGKYLNVDNVFDNRGRITKTSLPFKGDNATLWNTYNYDSYNRITSLTYASGKKDTYSYDKNKVVSVVDGVTTTKLLDVLDKEISVTDPMGTISFTYRPDGQLSQSIAPGDIITKFEYDVYGRKTKIIDPSLGTKTTEYDTSGNISKETDANGKVANMTYDSYSRVTKAEYVGEQTISYVYNTDGSLKSEISTNGTSKLFTYDNFARISEQKETVLDGKFLNKKYTYRTDGNIQSIAYSSNNGSIDSENFTYMNGVMSENKTSNGTVIWKLSKENDLGMVTEAITGNLIRTYGYDNYGLPTARVVKNGSTTIQNFAYSINPSTMNLNWRKDVSRNLQENFTYDGMNRLTGFAGKLITYNNIGNITNHSGVGKFEYSLTKPYAISQVTPYGNELPLRNQDITYNSQMRPSSITENGYVANLYYRADGERVKMQIKKNNVDQLIRHYIGGQYETESGVAGNKEKLYLGGDAYSAAAVLIKEGAGTWNIHYICRDYLGSITHITDGAGNLKQELSYDAWGRLRNPVNQVLYAIGSEPQLLLGRGFTGHEHLLMFGLINMNARLYDPVIGRFLSPDPYVQNPLLSQNYNRYSYCWNNPLRYSDPNGEFIHFIIGAVVGGLVNWGFNGFQFNAKGLGYFAVGAAVGALTAGVGMGMSSLLAGGSFSAGFLGTSSAVTAGTSFLNGAAIGGPTGLTNGFFGGLGNGLVDEQGFKRSMYSGVIGGAVGLGTGAFIGGMIGGIDAVIDGRRFMDGARVTKSDIVNSQFDISADFRRQQGKNNCLPACGEIVDNAFGGNYTQERLRLVGWGGVDKPIEDGKFWTFFGDETKHRVQGFGREGANQIKSTLNNGGLAAVGLKGEGVIGHYVVVQGTYSQTVETLRGKITTTAMLRVVDPGRGFRNIPFTEIIGNVFIIYPK